MASVLSDLRYAAREFRRRPGFALTAVLSLALGIGATSAVFSVVYGVLINPFPYVGDPAVVGRTLQLVRKNYQIVGVMPPRFRWREADIYVPLKVRLEPNIYFGVNLKIRPGVSTADANADLQPILEAFAAQTPAR